MFHATAIISKRRKAIQEFFMAKKRKATTSTAGKGRYVRSSAKTGRKTRKRRVNPFDERKPQDLTKPISLIGQIAKNEQEVSNSKGKKMPAKKIERPKWSKMTIEAVCRECGEIWDKANAMQMAAVHYDKTGHVVDVKQVLEVAFGITTWEESVTATVNPTGTRMPDVPPSPESGYKEPMADDDLVREAARPLDEVAAIREALATPGPLPDLFVEGDEVYPDGSPVGEGDVQQTPVKQALSASQEAPPAFDFD